MLMLAIWSVTVLALMAFLVYVLHLAVHMSLTVVVFNLSRRVRGLSRARVAIFNPV